jgi:hypothetical protein
VAALACVAVVWTARPRPVADDAGASAPYLGRKGAPALQLFVKRGARVAPWDPAVPVAAGDLLRLEVQPDRFTHVSVFEATRPAGSYERLYDAAIAPGKATALPSAWRVDAQPGDETLVVVLGSDPVAPAEVPRLLSATDGRHWTRRLVVAKAADQGGSPP